MHFVDFFAECFACCRTKLRLDGGELSALTPVHAAANSAKRRWDCGPVAQQYPSAAARLIQRYQPSHIRGAESRMSYSLGSLSDQPNYAALGKSMA